MTARRTRTARGATTVEFVIVVPVLIVAFLFVVGLGRMSHARHQVEDLAGEAARAASLERNTSLAAARGEQTVTAAMQHRGFTCHQLTVDVDVSSYRPGGVVRAQVTCVTNLSDVTITGLPGAHTFTAEASVPIEQFRSS
jgi:Flp pilus assembly protein TadG